MGLHRVGDGGKDHGDVLVLGGGEAGRGAGGSDGAHDGHVLGGEALSDLGGDGVVKARVLIDDFVIGALGQARVGKSLQKAFPAVVKRSVLAILGDADGGNGGGKSGRSENHGQNQRQNHRYKLFHFHFLLLFLVVCRGLGYASASPSSARLEHFVLSPLMCFQEHKKHPVPCIFHGTGCESCGATQIAYRYAAHCASNNARRLDNGCGTRRLLLACAFGRPRKSIRSALRHRDFTIRDSLGTLPSEVLLLLNGFFD